MKDVYKHELEMKLEFTRQPAIDDREPLYFDTEFIETEDGDTELISIGIIDNNSVPYYAISREFDVERAMKDEWISKHVLKPIYLAYTSKYPDHETTGFDTVSMICCIKKIGKSRKQLAEEIVEYVGDKEPLWIGYYSAYDWYLLAKLFDKLLTIPWNTYYHIDLMQELHGLGYKVKDPQAHNPLLDAIFVKELYRQIRNEMYISE